MKVQVEFNEGGIVSGDTKRYALEIFPELEPYFKQRKSYDEYYYSEGGKFDGFKVEITWDKIMKLNELGYYSLTKNSLTFL